MAIGFTNNFTQGEICEDAWDRADIQPVAKGCAQALNWITRIVGPLGKRRGFWDLGATMSTANPSRLVPFIRGRGDALMLEFGNNTCHVWNNDGTPLMSGMAQVSFATGIAAADLAGLRWKQVVDVIYLRHSAGHFAKYLQRNSNTSWEVHNENFTNGPWLTENAAPGATITVTGTSEADANADPTGAGSILTGTDVALVATTAIFDAGQVGYLFRLRQTTGGASVKGWSPGYKAPIGEYCLSVGLVYRSNGAAADADKVANPPVQQAGDQSDGGQVWSYRHDGAGTVLITAVADSTHASGHVINTLPFKTGMPTSYWSEAAYSAYRGLPRMWPSVREERMVEGATSNNPDFIDLTSTAGFGPSFEDFYPGLGTGQVLSTHAVRRRLGDDGGELIWSQAAAYLTVGTSSGEYLIAGSVLDEPIDPNTVVVKQLSSFGSADVLPARPQKGMLFVTADGEALRLLSIDTQQNDSGDELTLLAEHIGQRGLRQLAWVRKPDEYMAVRLGDGGLAFFTFHQEQQVKGWTTVALPGGWIVEDLAVLPGPGGYDTLWLQVSRTKDAATQRRLWLQSRRTDYLFMDGAQFYSGAPATVIGGLDYYEGEQVLVLADGAQITGLVVTGGQITLAVAASKVLVGLAYTCRFKSLDLAQGPLATALGERQRATGAIVSLMTAEAYVSLDGGPAERVTPRTPADVPGAHTQRLRKDVTLAGDSSREQHIVIEDSTAYDARIYSIRPKVQAGG